VLIVFLLGLLGLISDVTEIQKNVPIIGYGVSVAIMLISLGMAYRLIHYHRAGRVSKFGEPKND
ncbi:MAG: hypothetical protein DRH10_10665, partial [Deltaproteobacteria bacterium]